MSEIPLQLSEVTKRFGAFTAVDRLSMTVPAGQIVGFLGPNGAGKSTSLRMALGVMNPDEGEARLFGAPPRIETLKRVGFLPEERGLYKKMSPRASIAHFARLKGMTNKAAFVRADEMLASTGLADFGHSRISKLSKGMAQKVQILSSMAHRPDFLILDEPFSGLDPVNQQELEEMIREEHARGVTILFSTHVMEHAERLCDTIIMLTQGRKVFDGTLKEAYRTLERGARLAVGNGFDLPAVLSEKGFSVLAEAGETEVSADAPNWWRVRLAPGQDAQDALRAAIEAGVPIAGFAPEEARLRDVFVKLAGEPAGEDSPPDLPGKVMGIS